MKTKLTLFLVFFAIPLFIFSQGNPNTVEFKYDNAGKPIKQQIPNSTGVIVNERIIVPDYFYYLILNLHNTGEFKAMHKGSVIPFLRKNDIPTVVYSYFERRRR